MTLHELNKHFDARKQLAEVKALRNALLAASYPSGQSFDGLPRSSGVKDKVCSLAAEIAALDEKIAAVEAEVKAGKPAVSAFINGIKDDRARTIIKLRFVYCLEWKRVAELMGGKNTEDTVKRTCYRYFKNLSRDVP